MLPMTMQGPLCEDAARLGHCSVGLKRRQPGDPWVATRHPSCGALLASRHVAWMVENLSEADWAELARLMRETHARAAARRQREDQAPGGARG
jgi:hypothetical protein